MAHTSKYTGPWADWASGVDISVPASMLVGGVLYAVLLKLYPEGADVREPAIVMSSGAAVGGLAASEGKTTTV
jgi:hypothetical protein